MTADVDIDWVAIPGGTLLRGTPFAALDSVVAAHGDLHIPRAWILKEAPEAEVPVAAFAVSAVPVTNAQWARFARAHGRGVPDHVDGRPDHPVEAVSWADAVAFCDWLADLSSLPVRLPTETEWERVARGDDNREYPWGDTFAAGRANLANANDSTTAVGSFPAGASPYGVLDLAGNVDEWTATTYAPYPGAHADVPLTEDWATDPHVTRGGAYSHDRDLARCARRHGVYPPLGGAGFRLAMSTSGDPRA